MFSIKFLWIIIVSISLKHLVSLLIGDTVQAKLRRGLDPVLLSYALITAGDLVGLILCYNGIKHWNSGAIFNVGDVQAILQQLLAFRDFVDAFEHPPSSFLAYCIGASGLLWWLTLAHGLFQLKGYRRSPADYLVLAANCAMLGKDSRAQGFLEAAAAKTKEDCELKGQIYAAYGEFDKSSSLIRRAFHQTDDVPATAAYTLLKMWGGLLSLRAGQARYYQLVEYGAAHGLSDILLADLALSYCASGGNSRAFADYIAGSGHDRFGLSYLCLKWMADEEREIFDAYQTNEATDGAERALWLCLGAMVWPARRASDEDTGSFIQYWSGSALDEIRTIGIALSDDMDKVALVDILYMVQAYWSRIGIELYAVGAVVIAIGQTLPDNEVMSKIKSAWPALAPPPSNAIADPKAAAVQMQPAVPV